MGCVWEGNACALVSCRRGVGLVSLAGNLGEMRFSLEVSFITLLLAIALRQRGCYRDSPPLTKIIPTIMFSVLATRT